MKPRYAFAATLVTVAVAVLATLVVASLRMHVARAEGERKQIAYLGATLADLSPEACRKAGVKSGALIVAIDPGSPADKEDLREGDIITQFEGEPVTAAYQVYGKIRRMRVGELASLRFHREGSALSIGLIQLAGMDYGPPASDGGGADPELASRVDQLEQDVAALHRRVDALERTHRGPREKP